MSFKKYTYCLFIPFFFWFSAFSQETRIQGSLMLKNENSPLFGVNIIAKSPNDSTTLAYAISNDKGEFSLLVDEGPDSLLLIFRSLTVEELILSIPNKDQFLEISLNPFIMELKEMVLEGKRNPITSNNDTIFYDVSSISNSNDRFIFDVLSRLPGIEVDNTGMIRYQGKALEKFYIEGLDLLGGRYNLANRNMPISAVESIQILENHQPIAVLDSLVYSERTSLNLKLKRKNVWLGVIHFGSGFSPILYDINLTPMIFRSDFQILNSFQANNIGKDLQKELKVLTIEDLTKRWKLEEFNTWFGVRQVSSFGLSKEKYEFNESKIATINSLSKNKNDTEFRINLSFINDKIEEIGGEQTTFFLPGDSIRISEDIRNNFLYSNLSTELSWTKNIKKSYFKNSTKINVQDRREVGNILLNSESRMQDIELPFIELGNTLKGIKPFKKRLFNYESQINMRFSNQRFYLNTVGFDMILPQSNEKGTLLQTLKEKGYFTNNNIGITKRVAKNLSLTSKMGFLAKLNFMDSQMALKDSGGGEINIPENFSNKLRQKEMRAYLQNDLDFKTDKISFSLKVPLSYFNINFLDPRIDFKRNLSRVIFEPNFQGSYFVHSKLNFYFSFQKSNDFKGLHQLHPGFVFKDYRTIQQNLSDIPDEIQYNYSLSFQFKDPIYSYFASAGFNLLNSKMNTIIGNEILDSGEAILRAENFLNRMQSQVWFLRTSKYFPMLNSNLTISLDHQNRTGQQIIQGSIKDFNLKILNPRIIWGLRPKSIFGLTWNGSFRLIESEFENIEIGNIIQFNNKVELDLFPNEFHLVRFTADHFFNESNGLTNESTFIDASYRYRLIGKKVDFGFKIFNLLDFNTFENFNVNVFTLSSQFTQLRPRQFLFTISFAI